MFDALSKPKFPVTFEWDKFPDAPEHEYARVSNPARSKLESELTRLEGGKGAFATASGQSALLLALSLLKAGDHVICAADVYDGTIRTLKVLNKFWLDFTLLAPEEFADLRKHLHPNTKLVIVENPSSTFLNTHDTAKIKKAIGNAMLLVDNTVATPALQNPLAQGADFVVLSMGKFIGGQDDFVGGALIAKNERHVEELRHLQHTLGSVLAPADCAVALERLKTLPTRMKKHTENATLVAEALEEFGSIEKVHFPGFSGVIAVRFRDSGETKRFLKEVKIPKAQSYGGRVTRIQHPTTMMNSNLDEGLKRKVGLNDRLVRIGIGLEPADEIIEKLMAAL